MNGRLHDPQQGKEDDEEKEKPISPTLWRIDDPPSAESTSAEHARLNARRSNEPA